MQCTGTAKPGVFTWTITGRGLVIADIVVLILDRNLQRNPDAQLPMEDHSSGRGDPGRSAAIQCEAQLHFLRSIQCLA